MLILGSKSPRRKEILEMVNIPFKVAVSNALEDLLVTDPYQYAVMTSQKKAQSLIHQYPDDIILCCDTIVYIDNKILGKPHSKEEAFQMISKLQGKTHEVITGVFIGNKDISESFFVSTEVEVSKMSDEEITEYIGQTEPYDKAGSYAIQGIFAKYIHSIKGDYYNVMGLPINEVYNHLKKFKI